MERVGQGKADWGIEHEVPTEHIFLDPPLQTLYRFRRKIISIEQCIILIFTDFFSDHK